MRSASISASVGYGPSPRIPFSDWRITSMPGGMWLATSVGMPMPRLTVYPSRSSFTARRTMPSRSNIRLGLPHGAALDALLPRSHHDALHEDARRVNALRVEVADLDELLDLRDRDFAGRGRHRVEVARRFPVDQISQSVALPGRDHREVPDDPALEDVLASVELLGFLALRHERADPSGGVKARDPRATGAHPLGERALGDELDLELTRQELALELGVLPDVGRHHLADLAAPQEQPQSPVVHSAVVRDDRQVADAAPDEGGDEVFGDPAESEPADDQGRAVRDVPDGLVGRGHDLLDHCKDDSAGRRENAASEAQAGRRPSWASEKETAAGERRAISRQRSELATATNSATSRSGEDPGTARKRSRRAVPSGDAGRKTVSIDRTR